MNKHSLVIFTLFLGGSLVSCGCIDLFQDISMKRITYETHPTHITYHITYGFYLNLTGNGESTITYREDLPDLLSGSILNRTIINQLDGKIKVIGDNEMIFWNETFHDQQKIFLGISTDVIALSMLTSDLCGSNAMNLPNIKNMYPHLISSYCTIQKNETITFIDPSDPQIKNIAEMVKAKRMTNNSYLIAKDLFLWLKTNTSYQIHQFDQRIQPCHETLQKKTGDCDDLSFLFIALCRAVSIPARFIHGFLIDAKQTPVTATPHVWVEVFVGGNVGHKGWIPVECAGAGNIDAEFHQNFGVEDALHLRLYIDDGSNESLERYTNHISITYTTGIIIDLDHRMEVSDYNVLDSKNLCITNGSTRTYC